jgi:2-polyprenyl-6-methoxyphenol hydroxylase-like FAD-dependent oxidoreductase
MASPNKTKRPFEKIIIGGAGPSGLLLALLLAQHGIPSTVLEAWPWLDTRLRATQYGVPATRVFRRAGLLPDFRKASIPRFPAICWRRVADGEKLVEIDMSVVSEEEDRMTILPLGEIVQIMYKHCMDPAKSKGLIDVRFNHRVLGTGEDAHKAWVDVEIGKRDEEKRQERMEADYVVGCDGASSAVRRSLFGKNWPGQTFDFRFIVQNVFYDGFEKHGWEGGSSIPTALMGRADRNPRYLASPVGSVQ